MCPVDEQRLGSRPTSWEPGVRGCTRHFPLTSTYVVLPAPTSALGHSVPELRWPSLLDLYLLPYASIPLLPRLPISLPQPAASCWQPVHLSPKQGSHQPSPTWPWPYPLWQKLLKASWDLHLFSPPSTRESFYWVPPSLRPMLGSPQGSLKCHLLQVAPWCLLPGAAHSAMRRYLASSRMATGAGLFSSPSYSCLPLNTSIE